MPAKIGEFRNVKDLFALDIKKSEKLLIKSTLDIFLEPVFASGARISDRFGNEYLDFNSFVGTANIGHGRIGLEWGPGKVLNSLPNDFLSSSARRLAEKLVEIVPLHRSEKKVAFRSSGTQAVETALKLAMAHHKFNPRSSGNFLLGHFKNSFHGRTHGSLSLTDSKKEIRRRYFPVLQDVFYFGIPFPKCAHLLPLRAGLDHSCCWDDWLSVVNVHLLGARQGEIRLHALFMELVQGEGGINPVCPEIIRHICEEFQRRGTIIVVDEVQTGIGRTGEMFACDAYGIKPDIVLLAKSLAAGIPLSVIISNIDYEEKGLDSETFGGFPPACEVALKVLEIAGKEIKRTNQKKFPETIARRLEDLERKRLIRNPRGLGMMFGFDVPQRREEFLEECLNHGLVLIGAGRSAVRIMPPLAIEKEELVLGFDIIEKVAKKIFETPR